MITLGTLGRAQMLRDERNRQLASALAVEPAVMIMALTSCGTHRSVPPAGERSLALQLVGNPPAFFVGTERPPGGIAGASRSTFRLRHG
jgi:hypothetical protein